ncbi:MAG: 50S ribosomal protein L29 [Parcubacteria group bacterium]
MHIKELREKSKGELEKILDEKQKAVRKSRFDIAAKQVKNNRELRKAKRDIARILTLLKSNTQ